MAEAYERSGLEVEFVPVKNAGHDFEQVGTNPIFPSIDQIHQLTVAFFKHYLDR